MRSRFVSLIVAFVAAQWPVAVHACTVCMGGDDTKVGPAINAAIFLLLGCIGGVLALLTGFGIYLMKKASAPLPSVAEFQQS